jgi:hypothetical protein
LALLYQLLNRFTAIKGIPKLPFKLGPFNEIPTLQPGHFHGGFG